jgi:hypothetical protein
MCVDDDPAFGGLAEDLGQAHDQILKTGLRSSEDFREGVEAFWAKRKPSFRGR